MLKELREECRRANYCSECFYLEECISSHFNNPIPSTWMDCELEQEQERLENLENLEEL